jgi:Na+/melibiose symporter-like transporter
VIAWNLFMMIMLWSVSSLDYYLISFLLKYVPGNIYMNTFVSTSSEIVATMLAGFVYELFGSKVAFCLSFSVSAIGGFLIALTSAENTYLIAFFVLLAKFGISFAFTMVYMITP